MSDPSQLPPSPLSPARLKALGIDPNETAVVLVDHGSRRDESNALLLEVTELFREMTQLPIVEAAHMELAEPSIATAIKRAVERGATFVIICPYFLGPGRHWRQDIPNLAREGVAAYPSVRFLVTAPLGLHPLIQLVLQERIVTCLAQTLHDQPACEVCAHDQPCGIEISPPQSR